MVKAKQFIKEHKETIILYLVFVIGVVSCCFTRIRFNIFIFAFIFPACILYFTRKSKAKIGLPLAALGVIFGSSIAVYTTCGNDKPGLNILAGLALGILTFTPFLLDKLVYNRFFKNQLAISFLFPLTWISIEVLMELSPLGTLISMGYTPMYILPFIESVSFLGLYFISFIILFFNSAVVSFILSKKKEKKGLIIAASLIAFSFIYSGVYLLAPMTTNETFTAMTAYSTNDSDLKTRTKLSIDQNTAWFIKDAKDANYNKAELLVYPEEAFMLYDNEVEEFKTRCASICKENNIYAVVGIEITNEARNSNKNQAWIFDNNGELKAVYKKMHFVPFDEYNYEPGDGNIPLVETPFGKLSVVICMDNEFQSYVSKVGRMGADLLVAPSWFWPEAPRNIIYNDSYRAIENGVNLIKATEKGYSFACDYKGQVRCEYYNDEFYENKTKNHVFELPRKGVTTIYCYLGGFFNYVYIVALAGVITFSIVDIRKKNAKKI